jgi:hypothetical protein
MTSAGANTWSIPLELNNLESQIGSGGGSGVSQIIASNNISISPPTGVGAVSIKASLSELDQTVQGNGFNFIQMGGSSTGTPAIVLGGSQSYIIENTDLTPLFTVNNTGVQLGNVGSGYQVKAITVSPSTTSDTQVATTEFVQNAITTAGLVPSLQQVVNVGNGISNYTAGSNATIQSTNFSNDVALTLNGNTDTGLTHSGIKMISNADSSKYIAMDYQRVNLNGTDYTWSNIVAPPTSVSTVGAGTNINISGTSTNPVVNVNTAITGLTANPVSADSKLLQFNRTIEATTTPQSVPAPTYPKETATLINNAVGSGVIPFNSSTDIWNCKCITASGRTFIGGSNFAEVNISTGALTLSGVVGTVYSITEFPPSNVLIVCGNFTSIGTVSGITTSRAVYDLTTNTWSPFNGAGTFVGSSSNIFYTSCPASTTFSSTLICFGGNFALDLGGGSIAVNLVVYSWNGSFFDNYALFDYFQLNTTDTVYTLTNYSFGQIFVGGDFTTLYPVGVPTPYNYGFKLFIDFSSPPQPISNNGYNGIIRQSVNYPVGGVNIVVAGDFSSVDGDTGIAYGGIVHFGDPSAFSTALPFTLPSLAYAIDYENSILSLGGANYVNSTIGNIVFPNNVNAIVNVSSSKIVAFGTVGSGHSSWKYDANLPIPVVFNTTIPISPSGLTSITLSTKGDTAVLQSSDDLTQWFILEQPPTITSVVAGTGIGVSTTGGVSTISNTGLLSATAGSGISISTTSGVATITNTGLLTVPPLSDVLTAGSSVNNQHIIMSQSVGGSGVNYIAGDQLIYSNSGVIRSTLTKNNLTVQTANSGANTVFSSTGMIPTTGVNNANHNATGITQGVGSTAPLTITAISTQPLNLSGQSVNAPTVSPATDNSTKVATTSFVQSAITSAGISTTTQVASPVNLTTASTQNQVLTGSLAYVVRLPDATTLVVGRSFIININTSATAYTGTINNFTGTALVSNGQQGSIFECILLTNSTSAGTWDVHSFLPTTANFGSTGLVYQGNLTFTGSGTSVISQSGSGNISITAPTLTGVPLCPTATVGTNTTQVASCQFVQTAVSGATAPPINSVLASGNTATGKTLIMSDGGTNNITTTSTTLTANASTGTNAITSAGITITNTSTGNTNVATVSGDKITAGTDNTVNSATGTTITSSVGNNVVSANGYVATNGANVITSSASVGAISVASTGASSIVNSGSFQQTNNNTGYTTDAQVSITNTNSTAGNQIGVPTIHLYKAGRNGVLNDVVGAQIFYGNNYAGSKVEWGKIQTSIRNTSAGADRGALSLFATSNGTSSEYLRCDGGSSLVVLSKGLNTGGNSITASAGNIVLDASGSANTGSIIETLKAGGNLIINNLPTSSAGLPTNAVWRNGNVLNIV